MGSVKGVYRLQYPYWNVLFGSSQQLRKNGSSDLLGTKCGIGMSSKTPGDNQNSSSGYCFRFDCGRFPDRRPTRLSHAVAASAVSLKPGAHFELDIEMPVGPQTYVRNT